MSNKKYHIGKEMFLEGKSLTKISKELGISAAWFGRYLKDQGIDTRHNKPTIQFNRKYFKVIDTEDKAYWLGFLAADGCINEQFKNGKLKAMTMEISVGEQDKGHLIKFCNSLGLSEDYIKTRKVKLDSKVFTSYRVTLSSTGLCRDLISLGVMPRKSLDITIPPTLTNSIYFPHFIRGYFDGNGYIAKDKKLISFSSGSPMLLVQLNTLFSNFGCSDVVINQDFPRSLGVEMRYHKTQGYDIITNFMYKDATIYLERKYNRYIALLGSNI